MKYCDKCGAQIPEGSLACPACQTPVTVLPVTNVQPTYAPVQTPVTPVVAPEVPAVQPVQPAVAPAPVQPAVAPAPVQPNYTQPVAPVPPAQPKQKSAGIPVVVAIILLVIVAISGLLLGRVFFGSVDCKEKKCDIVTNVDNDDESENPQHNVEASDEDDKEEEEDEPTQVGTSKEAYISGHKFTIPSKYLYEVDNEEILYVYDESTEWIAEMTLTQYLYSTISGNIETILSNFTSSGFTVEGYEEKTIAGMTLIEIKVVDSSGVKILAAYTKVSDAYVGVITVYNQTSGEYETEKFEEVVEIMAGAEKTTSSRDNANNKSNAIVNLLPAA